jgi:hypothetical protein
MSEPMTVFGSIRDYRTGGIEVIDDNPKNYVFSNIFDVAAKSKPYERVAVAKNFEYVIEAVRAEGVSPWYTCAHDEFTVAMDGEVTLELVKLDDPDAHADPDSQGAHLVEGTPKGRKMGWIKLRRGHMALLPVGAAYRFSAEAPCCLILQSIDGPVTVAKWAEICQSKSLV